MENFDETEITCCEDKKNKTIIVVRADFVLIC
jgi:hypothetical protein